MECQVSEHPTQSGITLYSEAKIKSNKEKNSSFLIPKKISDDPFNSCQVKMPRLGHKLVNDDYCVRNARTTNGQVDNASNKLSID